MIYIGTMQDTDLPAHIYDGVIDKALMDALFCTNTGEYVCVYVYVCMCVCMYMYVCVCDDDYTYIL